jgi:hypothetical protein
MARAHKTARQHESLKAGPGEPLIAIPTEDGGTIYYTSVEEADAAITEEMIQRALSLAGAWSDLADEDVEGDLERMRHEAPPSPPISL